VTAYLGRDRYERTASCEDARAGMRNGYCPTTVIILSRESDHAFD
jgi:putative transposase